MKGKSIILGGIAIVVVVGATNLIYSLCDKIKQDHAPKPVVQTQAQIQNQEAENITPKQKEIALLKSQLLYLISDKVKFGTVNQNILDQMKGLLDAKTSGVVKINVKNAESIKNNITTYWAAENHFSTEDGVAIAKDFSTYINNLVNYLNEGIKTGELNVSDMPQFGASNFTKLDNDMNNTKIQLLGLGSSLDLSSQTPFTIQNSNKLQNPY
ncbi:MAG: hypothetical protein ACRC41_15555 [Sarcina sp.]